LIPTEPIRQCIGWVQHYDDVFREGGRGSLRGKLRREVTSSQARALPWTTGLRSLLPAARLRLETWQASQGESFTPLAYDLAGRIQAGCDDIIGKTFAGEQDDLGTDDVTVRRRISPCHRLEGPAFFAGKLDSIWTSPRHRSVYTSDARVSGCVLDSTKNIRRRIC